MKRMSWLDERKDEILSLYDSGLKQTEIAEKYGVSHTAISLRLRKWGASNPDGNRFKRIEIDKETLYDLYWNKKQHPSQIAKRYNCHKQVITNRMLQYGIPFRTKSEARMGKLNPIYGVGHNKKTRKKMSEAYKNGAREISKNGWGNGHFYNTPNQGEVWMRSTWEIKVADYLTANNLDWYYEYERLSLDETSSYLPDFYIPLLGLYIEVKGRLIERDEIKLKKAMEKYNVIIWDRDYLYSIGLINSSGH